MDCLSRRANNANTHGVTALTNTQACRLTKVNIERTVCKTVLQTVRPKTNLQRLSSATRGRGPDGKGWNEPDSPGKTTAKRK